MQTFAASGPITATISLIVGSIRVSASERTDAEVDVRPGDETDEADQRAAEQVKVGYSDGRLTITGPKKTVWPLFGRSGSVTVTIGLPAGSRVDASATADVHCDGRLGESRVHSAAGDVRLDEAGELLLDTASGDVTVGRSAGHTEITTANGRVRIRRIDGTAVIKSANGPISVGEVTGRLRVKTANGDISVDRALTDVDARTAYGDVRIGECASGSVSLVTAAGRLDIGIPEGTAAWLDVGSQYGDVRSQLEPSEGPASDRTVRVRARTGHGDVVIRRA
jgi:DUF4097 and DUF4098 domain-containing protein YvlB